MFKKTTLTLILLYSAFTLAQHNGIIVYKAFPTEGTIERSADIQKSKMPQVFEGVDDALKGFEYRLEFIGGKSHFYLKEGLEFSNAVLVAKAFAGQDAYYTDTEANDFIQFKDYQNNKIQIVYEPSKNWKTYNETKIIDGNICFKATTEKTVIMKGEYKSQTVTAWYCPKIPIPLGPKEFGNLPGLILELQDGRITYLATKIDLDSKEALNVTLKTKAPKMSQKDFDSMLFKKAQEYKSTGKLPWQ